MYFFPRPSGLFPLTISISVSLEKAAREFIRGGMMDDGLRKRI
jgi:hypothetical protein